MYRCPKCGNLCGFVWIPTYDGATQMLECLCCGWSNLNVETKTSTQTENIDLGNVSTSTEMRD